MDLVRSLVSKQKRRWESDGYNLDLTYITDSIIAMGFPSEGTEGLFRNPLGEVQRFLRERHGESFHVYNLCIERSYKPEKFAGRVSVYPFAGTSSKLSLEKGRVVFLIRFRFQILSSPELSSRFNC